MKFSAAHSNGLLQSLLKAGKAALTTNAKQIAEPTQNSSKLPNQFALLMTQFGVQAPAGLVASKKAVNKNNSIADSPQINRNANKKQIIITKNIVPTSLTRGNVSFLPSNIRISTPEPAKLNRPDSNKLPDKESIAPEQAKTRQKAELPVNTTKPGEQVISVKTQPQKVPFSEKVAEIPAREVSNTEKGVENHKQLSGRQPETPSTSDSQRSTETVINRPVNRQNANPQQRPISLPGVIVTDGKSKATQSQARTESQIQPEVKTAGSEPVIKKTDAKSRVTPGRDSTSRTTGRKPAKPARGSTSKQQNGPQSYQTKYNAAQNTANTQLSADSDSGKAVSASFQQARTPVSSFTTASAKQAPQGTFTARDSSPMDLQELVSGVKLSLKAGKRELLLNLKPAALGRAMVSLRNVDNRLVLEFTVESLGARQAIEAESSQLREALAAVGFQSVTIDVRPPEAYTQQSGVNPDNQNQRQSSNRDNNRRKQQRSSEQFLSNPRMLGYNTFDLIA